MNLANLEEIEHLKELKTLIRKEIEVKGSISFARFMELALYAPGLGYYSAGWHKLGSQGDFVTAPEISPLFAKCIARQALQILSAFQEKTILELGAGTGRFAKDLLLELEKLNALPDHYFILEVSADLRQRQKELLTAECPHLLGRIQWLESLVPDSIEGIIFANEVMDAFPVHCFRIEDEGVFERCVTWQQDNFTWINVPASAQLAESIAPLQLPEGYESEINFMISPWIASCASALKKGVILLFDYGYGRAEYYHSDRSMGTLMCYRAQTRHDDPFLWVGAQDMTAHVDFTTVAEAAIDANLQLAGYTTQAAFLFSCGLIQVSEETPLTIEEQFHQGQMIKKLILPSEMGEAIKVMALTKTYDQPLKGFALQDRRGDL